VCVVSVSLCVVSVCGVFVLCGVLCGVYCVWVCCGVICVSVVCVVYVL